MSDDDSDELSLKKAAPYQLKSDRKKAWKRRGSGTVTGAERRLIN